MLPDTAEVAVVEDAHASWVAAYKRALLSIEARIPVNVRKILVGHSQAADRRLSVLEMGQIAGYKGTRAASIISQLKLSKVAPEHIPYLKRHSSRFRELQT